MISFAYLWNEVRVKGGVYGTGFDVRRNGTVLTYSYRDPSPVRSIDTNRGIGDFLRGLYSSGQKLDGFIISAIAELEPLLSPADMGNSADNDWFRSFSREDAAAERKQILGTTLEEVLRFADIADSFAESAPCCIVAGENLLSETDGMEKLRI